MPSNGYKRRKLRSPCCEAPVNVSSFTRTLERRDISLPSLPVGKCLTGVCDICGKTVMRVNPETGRQEWLPEGEDPLTRRQLELVSP
jgi:hypothetical protein